jgi:signal peptidase I
LSVIRDTVESVWVAIILAFVLRAFMVEAFVIPTGSMAPRLMGEHYDLVCSACGYEYSYGWPPHGRSSQNSVSRRDQTSPVGAGCPSCTYRFNTSKKYVNGGDRVLVMKYLYRFVEPKPFDVVVFRNPQSNANNYIKRLIGLPGETLEIVHGDVYVIPPGKDQAEIRRKPDRAQDVMWQIICDIDYQPDMEKL